MLLLYKRPAAPRMPTFKLQVCFVFVCDVFIACMGETLHEIKKCMMHETNEEGNFNICRKTNDF